MPTKWRRLPRQGALAGGGRAAERAPLGPARQPRTRESPAWSYVRKTEPWAASRRLSPAPGGCPVCGALLCPPDRSAAPPLSVLSFNPIGSRSCRVSCCRIPADGGVASYLVKAYVKRQRCWCCNHGAEPSWRCLTRQSRTRCGDEGSPAAWHGEKPREPPNEEDAGVLLTACGVSQCCWSR